MVTLNLQWLAIIPALVGLLGLWQITCAVLLIVRGREIEPLIGMAVGAKGLAMCAGGAVIAWLIWMAFRVV